MPRPELAGAVPLPTQALGLGRLWLWSLPARALTWLSLAIFAATLLVLSSTRELRVLFRAPVPAGLLAGSAAVLALSVAWAGRERPGRLFPRLWPLFLAASTGLLLLLLSWGSAWANAPLLQAWAVASMASSLVLSLRLARPAAIRRGTEWIVLVAMISIALFLTIGLPLAARASDLFWQSAIDRAVHGLEAMARDAELAAKPRPEASEESWKEVEARLAALATYHPVRFMRHRQLWAAAATLGRDAELAAAARNAIRTAGKALSSERAPSLGQLGWPAIWFDRERSAWVQDPRFATRSRTVDRYYYELARLLGELRPEAGGAETRQLFEAERERWQRRHSAMRNSWTDGWAMPQGRGPELAELLDQPVFKSSYRAYCPVDLRALMDVTARAAWSMGAQPGCLRHRYSEDGQNYLRIDCFAYARNPLGKGAELLIDARLVYKSASPLLDFDRELPDEVYLLFPEPSSASTESYQAAVMEPFARAVERAHPTLQLAADRSGTAMKGFRLIAGRYRLRVHSSSIKHFAQRDAIEVRAFWE